MIITYACLKTLNYSASIFSGEMKFDFAMVSTSQHEAHGASMMASPTNNIKNKPEIDKVIFLVSFNIEHTIDGYSVLINC